MTCGDARLLLALLTADELAQPLLGEKLQGEQEVLVGHGTVGHRIPAVMAGYDDPEGTGGLDEERRLREVRPVRVELEGLEVPFVEGLEDKGLFSASLSASRTSRPP